jgi:glycosyltransferase involved in cell wall biosynthesis
MISISVVTTSFNQAAYLEQTLTSVQAQSYPALEHIVVDGASTDGTLNLLAGKCDDRWAHLHWVSEPDGGQTQAMNKGLRMAKGDIIGWLNSDDLYRPGCFEAVARVFKEHPEVDVLYGDYTIIDKDGRHLCERREIEPSRLVLFYHHILFIPTTATFFRRRIFDEGYWLDESLQYAMDHEFFVRLAIAGFQFLHVSALLADFRLHPESKTCATGARQLAETRWVRNHLSPVARRMRPGLLRSMCLGGLQFCAAMARYSEKFLRGYYLPPQSVPPVIF